MKINELVASSAKIASYNNTTKQYTRGHYSKAYVENNKIVGRALDYNKTVLYKPESSVVEIGIYFTSVTETGKVGHYCQIALRGIEMEEKSRDEVFRHLRTKNNGKYATYSDEELLEIIGRGDNVYYGKYTLQSRNHPDKFLVMQPTISGDTDIRVRCSCASFMFDIAWYNADHHCLIGSRPPQTRKYRVNPDARPVRNVNRKPGLCKHLMVAVALLQRDGFLKGGTDKFNKSTTTLMKKTSTERISSAEANALIKRVMDQHKQEVRYTRQMWSGKEVQVPTGIRYTNKGMYWSNEAVPKEVKDRGNESIAEADMNISSAQLDSATNIYKEQRFTQSQRDLLAWKKSKNSNFSKFNKRKFK